MDREFYNNYKSGSVAVVNSTLNFVVLNPLALRSVNASHIFIFIVLITESYRLGFIAFHFFNMIK